MYLPNCEELGRGHCEKEGVEYCIRAERSPVPDAKVAHINFPDPAHFRLEAGNSESPSALSFSSLGGA